MYSKSDTKNQKFLQTQMLVVIKLPASEQQNGIVFCRTFLIKYLFWVSRYQLFQVSSLALIFSWSLEISASILLYKELKP